LASNRLRFFVNELAIAQRRTLISVLSTTPSAYLQQHDTVPWHVRQILSSSSSYIFSRPNIPQLRAGPLKSQLRKIHFNVLRPVESVENADGF
jgi:hypothetical protein